MRARRRAIKSRGRKGTTLTLTRIRSAVTNGSKLLNDLDQRCTWARRLRDLIADHTSDLGGPDAISEAERVLIRRASMLVLQLELMEQAFALSNGGAATAAQLDGYARAAGHLRRILETLGLERRPRLVAPVEQFNRLVEGVRAP